MRRKPRSETASDAEPDFEAFEPSNADSLSKRVSFDRDEGLDAETAEPVLRNLARKEPPLSNPIDIGLAFSSRSKTDNINVAGDSLWKITEGEGDGGPSRRRAETDRRTAWKGPETPRTVNARAMEWQESDIPDSTESIADSRPESYWERRVREREPFRRGPEPRTPGPYEYEVQSRRWQEPDVPKSTESITGIRPDPYWEQRVRKRESFSPRPESRRWDQRKSPECYERRGSTGEDRPSEVKSDKQGLDNFDSTAWNGVEASLGSQSSTPETPTSGSFKKDAFILPWLADERSSEETRTQNDDWKSRARQSLVAGGLDIEELSTTSPRPGVSSPTDAAAAAASLSDTISDMTAPSTSVLESASANTWNVNSLSLHLPWAESRDQEPLPEPTPPLIDTTLGYKLLLARQKEKTATTERPPPRAQETWVAGMRVDAESLERVRNSKELPKFMTENQEQDQRQDKLNDGANSPATGDERPRWNFTPPRDDLSFQEKTALEADQDFEDRTRRVLADILTGTKANDDYERVKETPYYVWESRFTDALSKVKRGKPKGKGLHKFEEQGYKDLVRADGDKSLLEMVEEDLSRKEARKQERASGKKGTGKAADKVQGKKRGKAV